MEQQPAFSESLLNDGLEVALEWGPNLSRPFAERLAERHPRLGPAELQELEKRCNAAMSFGHNLVSELAVQCGGVSRIQGFHPAMAARYPWVNAANLSRIFSQGQYYAWKDGLG